MKILTALILLFVGIVNAADVERTVDLDKESTYTMTCTAPVARTDGSPLAPDEIQTYTFHRSSDGNVYTQVAEQLACEYTEDLASLPENETTYYRAGVVDTGERASSLSVDRLLLTPVRVAAPNPPTDLRGP